MSPFSKPIQYSELLSAVYIGNILIRIGSGLSDVPMLNSVCLVPNSMLALLSSVMLIFTAPERVKLLPTVPPFCKRKRTERGGGGGGGVTVLYSTSPLGFSYL